MTPEDQQQIQEPREIAQLLQQIMAQISTLTTKVGQLEKGQETPENGNEDTQLPSPKLSGKTSGSISTSASDTVEGKPTKNLGPLAEFSGNRDELEPWIAQAQAKLAVDYTSCTEATNMTAQCLLDQLRLSFGDPHRQEKAQRKLHKLRQTNKPFMEHFTEFRKLVLEAGGTNWPDEILKAYLEAGLSQELQRSMIGLGSTSQSFEDYCTELKRVSNQLEAFNLRNIGKKPQQGWQQDWWRGQNKVGSAGSTGRQSGSKPKPTTPQQDKMDWEPTGPARAAQGRRVKWVDEQEMQKRKDEGRCLRCGDSRHRVAQCPWLPPRRPARLAKPTQQEEHVGPELEDLEDESSSQQSEN
ncbi:hypothetical protein GTA08_BOTSDO02821 [Botryosphaeria dothidea]|uniref:Retrotransposon gag protein n=1 Tax=Botryosphaeria dothidea TaxID=55169 RepID=A0A8H4IZ03_9PEZI|nr:hypothetical protein GTA08_BOTSDO02821 [Botryosphaeria dothidea]